MADTMVALTHQLRDTAVLSGPGETNIGRDFYASYQAVGSTFTVILSGMFPVVVPDEEVSLPPASVWNTPILVTDRSLRNGVFAHLQVGEDGLVLIDSVTGIFGVGAEPREVIDDFLAALREHAAVLAAQDRLSPGLQEQLAYLQRHLAA